MRRQQFLGLGPGGKLHFCFVPAEKILAHRQAGMVAQVARFGYQGVELAGYGNTDAKAALAMLP